MKNEAYFSKIDNIGELSLDYIFFEFEMEPLLFTCVDKDDNLYFCHCYKMLYEQKWFVVPVSSDVLTDLIEEKMDIRNLILLSQQIFDITRDVNGKEICTQKKPSDIIEEDLPAVGVFLKCDKEKAKAYINEREYRFATFYEYLVDIHNELDPFDISKSEDFDSDTILFDDNLSEEIAYDEKSYDERNGDKIAYAA